MLIPMGTERPILDSKERAERFWRGYAHLSHFLLKPIILATVLYLVITSLMHQQWIAAVIFAFAGVAWGPMRRNRGEEKRYVWELIPFRLRDAFWDLIGIVAFIVFPVNDFLAASSEATFSGAERNNERLHAVRRRPASSLLGRPKAGLRGWGVLPSLPQHSGSWADSG